MRKSLFSVLVLTAPLVAQDAPPTGGSFKVTFDASVQTSPYSGRVFVALSKQPDGEPRRSIGDPASQNPVFSVEAKDVAPGASVVIDASAVAFPMSLAEVEAGDYAAQAVARRHTGSPYPGFGDGDLYSEPVTVTIKPGDAGILELKLTKIASTAPFKETDRIKLVEIRSALLSEFYGKDIMARAAVILPTNWKDVPGTRHPTLYFAGGFGATHAFAATLQGRLPKSADEVMVVVLDGMGQRGPTVFADSANNGPRARMLLEELIPAVESRFHGAASADIRWLAGISTGAWSCMWLAINHPDSFGNCWAFCPDPVDFGDFQRIDLYAPGANVYKDESGERRPAAHNGREVTVRHDDVGRKERVTGFGGRIQAFEDVCSPRGENGLARPIFDRQTGAVDAEVAKLWEAYDIRLLLERNWETLAPKLDGKVHVYAGEFDNFYLEGAVRRLEASLKDRGLVIDVHITPGSGHDIPQMPWKVLFQILRDRAAGSSNLPSIQTR